jgi:hypothetical protein
VIQAKSLPTGMFLCEESTFSLDTGDATERARTLFHQLYPDEQFLPKVPNPDHVVWEQEPSEEESSTA